MDAGCDPEILAIQAARATSHNDTRPAHGWEDVSLPDVWTKRWPAHSGSVWYRIDWQPDCPNRHALPEKPIGVGLSGINMAGAIYLNDALLWSDTSLEAPLSHSWNMPRWWSLPRPALLRGVNTLWIRVVGPAELTPGLGLLWLGDSAKIEAEYERRLWRQRTAYVMAAVLSAAVGCIFLVIWFMQRQEHTYGWYALMSLCWVLYLSSMLATSPWPVWPITATSDALFNDSLTMSRLNLMAMALYVHCFCIFSFRFGKQILPRIERALCALTLLNIAVMLAVPRTHLQSASQIILLLCSLTFFVNCLQIQWHCLRNRQPQLMLQALCAAVFFVVGIHDLLVVFTTWSAHQSWSPLTSLMTTLFMALLLGARLATSTRDIERFNLELGERITHARNELSQALEREHTQMLEHTRLQERVQLAHDLHDGLGGSLVRSIAIVERAQRTQQPLANERVLSLLKMLRDDLRQMIDFGSSTGASVAATPDLWTAPLRHRFTRLLDELNIDWDWHCDPEWRSDKDKPTALQCLSLARIMEEALSNSLKHSRAQKISVCCTQPQAQLLIVSIQDNGIGFDVQAAQDSAGLCVGMRSMAARAQRIGGSFQVHSSPATGTLIRVELPLNSHTASLSRQARAQQT